MAVLERMKKKTMEMLTRKDAMHAFRLQRQHAFSPALLITQNLVLTPVYQI